MPDKLVRLELSPQVTATSEGVLAIEQADTIILGPGSFLTSIMAPLLLPEVGRAIENNSNAGACFLLRICLPNMACRENELERETRVV